MAQCSPFIGRGGIAAAFVLILSAPSSPQDTQPAFQIRKLGEIRLDFGKENVSGPALFRVSRAGDIYFLSFHSGKLFRFDSLGKLSRSVAVGGFFSPAQTGLALGQTGDLFLFDSKEKMLHRYDAGLDVIGKYRLKDFAHLETVHDFLAASWGDLLLSGGENPQLWRLVPSGKGLSLEQIVDSRPGFYLSLSELPGQKLVAYDHFDRQLVFLDRFANRLDTISSSRYLKLGATESGVICALLPEGELELLDAKGYPAGSFKAEQLGLKFERIADFWTAGQKLYLFDGSAILGVFELTPAAKKPDAEEP